MRKLLFLFLLSAVALAAGAEEYENYKVKVGQFDKIKVQDNVNVVYRCLPDSSGYVQYRGAKEFADAFIITPKQDGTLKIQVSTEDVGHPDLPVLYVYSDFLVGVENASNFSLTVENPSPCAAFKATQVGNGTVTVENVKTNKLTASIATGNGTVNVSGSCQDALFKMVGTGIISADRLKSENVACKILGSGSIGCWPLSLLTVKGLGSTKIYYKGSPKIKKSGGGKIFPLPEGGAEDTVVTYDGQPRDSSVTVVSDGDDEEEVDVEEADSEDEEMTVEEADSEDEEITVVEEGEDEEMTIVEEGEE